MQRLSGVDATFLYLEAPASHMHVSSVIIADPSTNPRGGRFSFEQYKEMIANRLHLVKPWRRRLVEVPFGLHHPVWIEDPDFDLEYHVRRAALPSPGGMRELCELAADLHGRPLDRSRPLWELYIVEGLQDGLIAAIGKTHHAAIDGVSGAEIIVNLLDLTPETVVHPPPEEPWRGERVPSDAEMVAYAARSLAGQPAAAAKALRRTVEFGLNLRNRNRQPDVKPPPAPFTAPTTIFNRPITPHRRFAVADVPLEQVKLVKNTFGGTVNDVVMALCAGALRRYLEAVGAAVEEDLVAMVPVSVRAEDERGTNGNRISAMLVSLATTEPDDVARLQLIREHTLQAKGQEEAVSAETLMDWTEFAAPAVAARASRLLMRMTATDRMRPLFNVTISNVPGPSMPLYSCGAELRALYPMGPINDGSGLNMTVMSYHGNVHFGLVGCRETVPDLDRVPEHLRDTLDVLVEAARARAGDGAPDGGRARPARKRQPAPR